MAHLKGCPFKTFSPSSFWHALKSYPDTKHVQPSCADTKRVQAISNGVARQGVVPPAEAGSHSMFVLTQDSASLRPGLTAEPSLRDSAADGSMTDVNEQPCLHGSDRKAVLHFNFVAAPRDCRG